MHQNLRWIESYLRQWQCAKCRRSDELWPYFYPSGRPLDQETIARSTLDGLRSLIKDTEVMCGDCWYLGRLGMLAPTLRENRRRLIPAAIETANVMLPKSHGRAEETAAHGSKIKATKVEFVERALDEWNCAVCGETDPVVLSFYPIDKSPPTVVKLTYDRSSLPDLIRRMEQSVVLCANCERRVEAGTAGLGGAAYYRTKMETF